MGVILLLSLKPIGNGVIARWHESILNLITISFKYFSWDRCIFLGFAIPSNLDTKALSNFPTIGHFKFLGQGFFWVKTHSKEPQRLSNVKFYHKKLEIYLFLFIFMSFETMLIIANYSF
jgi:hypothetical protein